MHIPGNSFFFSQKVLNLNKEEVQKIIYEGKKMPITAEDCSLIKDFYKDNTLQIARRMILKNYAVSEIQEMTDLTAGEIEELMKEGKESED